LPGTGPKELRALFEPYLSWSRSYSHEGIYLFYGQRGAPVASASPNTGAGSGPAAAANPNPGSPGQPNQSCGSATAPNTPGNAASAPGSAFNPNGQAGSVYAGQQPQNSNNTHSVSQYDVACFQQP